MILFNSLSDAQAAALIGGAKKTFIAPDDSTNNPNDYVIYSGNSTNSKQLESEVIGPGQLKNGSFGIILL